MHGARSKSGSTPTVPQVSKATAVRLAAMVVAGLLLLVLLMAFGPGMDSDVPAPVVVTASDAGRGAVIPTPVPGARRSTLRGRNSKNNNNGAPESTSQPAAAEEGDATPLENPRVTAAAARDTVPTAAHATALTLRTEVPHGEDDDATPVPAPPLTLRATSAAPPTKDATNAAAAAAAVVASEEELEAAAAAPVATLPRKTASPKSAARAPATTNYAGGGGEVDGDAADSTAAAPTTNALADTDEGDVPAATDAAKKKKKTVPKKTTAPRAGDDEAVVAAPPPSTQAVAASAKATVSAADHDAVDDDGVAGAGENAATPWSELPQNAPAVAPCFVTHCARKQYTQFKHYQLCDSVVGAMKQLQLNSSEHDLINATRLTYTPGEGQTRRTQAEVEMDKKCDPSHGKYGPSLLRPGMRSEAPSRPTIEACVDPRYPLRMPLAVHRLNSGPALTCYARGDMVCDIVGRSGGWEGELMQMLDSALNSIRRHRLDQLLKARENAFERLSARPGVTREAVVKAVQEKSPFFKATSGHRASIKKREEAIAAKRAADEAGTKVKAGAHTDGGLRTTVKPAHRLSTDARRFSQFFATFGVSALERGAFPLNATRDVPPNPEDKTNRFINRNLGSFNPGGSNALYNEHGVYYGETASDPADRTRANFDVEYVDIGANVGAFLLHFWRHGYPVTAFEALPFNMQLLSSSLCLNGVRAPVLRSEELTSSGDPGWEGTRKLSKLPFNMTKAMAQEAAKFAKFMRSRARLESRRGSAAIKPSKLAPGVVVYHTALGRERDVQCVMMSEDLNFGDTWISCNATHVAHTASEFPFQQYRRRGYVNMTTLDSFMLPQRTSSKKSTTTAGSSNSGKGAKMSHEAAARGMMVDLIRREVAAVVRAVLPDDEAASDVAVNATVTQVFNAKTDLPADFFEKDYIAKIDVEGHEIAVVEGAQQLLQNKSVRPRLWLSEVWRTLNITRYAEIMMGDAGYVGLVPLQSRWLMTVADATEYHRTMKDNMDTVIWVEPEYATLLNRAHALSYPKADALEKLRQISNDLKAKRVAADLDASKVTVAAAAGVDLAVKKTVAAAAKKKMTNTATGAAASDASADDDVAAATTVAAAAAAAADSEDTPRPLPVARKGKKRSSLAPAAVDGDDEKVVAAAPAVTTAGTAVDAAESEDVPATPRKSKKLMKKLTTQAAAAVEDVGIAASSTPPSPAPADAQEDANASEEEASETARTRRIRAKKKKVATPTAAASRPPAAADTDTHDEPVEGE